MSEREGAGGVYKHVMAGGGGGGGGRKGGVKYVMGWEAEFLGMSSGGGGGGR